MNPGPSARMAFPGEWLVCFAVKEEAQAFMSMSGGTQPGKVRTLITGMGRANAERTLRENIKENKPSLLLTCGFAGGLDPALPKGAALFEADPQSPIAGYLVAAGAKPGRFHCSERIAVTAAEKQTLRETTGADAVEMESAHIRAICRDHQIPSATMRVILDIADEDLPLDFNALMTASYSLDFRKLALLLIRSPSKIGCLLELQKASRKASEAMAKVLQNVVGQIEPEARLKAHP